MHKGTAVAACVIIITGKHSLKCFGAIVAHSERLCVLTIGPRHSVDINVYRNIFGNRHTGFDAVNRTECSRAIAEGRESPLSISSLELPYILPRAAFVATLVIAQVGDGGKRRNCDLRRRTCLNTGSASGWAIVWHGTKIAGLNYPTSCASLAYFSYCRECCDGRECCAPRAK